MKTLFAAVAIALLITAAVAAKEVRPPGAASDDGHDKLICPGNIIWRGDVPTAGGWWSCASTEICGNHHGQCVRPSW